VLVKGGQRRTFGRSGGKVFIKKAGLIGVIRKEFDELFEKRV